MPRTVGDIGEFGLIDLLGQARAVTGIGDDTAVLDMPGPDYLLATVDALVEGTHFRPPADRARLGMRALAVNLSDIAAMGGVPRWALVSLVLRPDLPVTEVRDLYHGLGEEAEKYGVQIVGGNIARSDGPLSVGVTLLGVVPKRQVVKRSGARVGDVLMVTGTLGRDAAMREVSSDEAIEVPTPRVTVGRSLAERELATAMMDLSDGLGSDLHHLAAASGVGAALNLDAVPVAIQARDVAERLGKDAHELALYGGEDYELLVAIDPERVGDAVAASGEIPLTPVGTVLDPAEGVVMQWPGGRREPLPVRGWRHF